MDRSIFLDSPCPTDPSLVRSTNFKYEDESIFNTTAAVEFTTEIKAPVLTASKPRRAKRQTRFQICEDASLGSDSTTRAGVVKRKAMDGGSLMLSQPAQRFQRPRVSFIPVSSQSSIPVPQKVEIKCLSKESTPSDRPIHHPLTKTEPEKDALKKDVRRHTIYIPPDDTTVPTVFMGIFSPLKSNSSSIDGNTQEESLQIGALEARIVAKQQAKRRAFTSPCRQPLTEKTRLCQASTINRDIPGKNGGKENLPPGLSSTIVPNDSCGKKSNPEISSEEYAYLLNSGLPSTTIEQPSKLAPLLSKSANSPILSKPIGQKGSAITTMGLDSIKGIDAVKIETSTKKKTSILRQSELLNKPVSITQTRPQSKQSYPRRGKPILDQKYPLLTEDISNPILYEDNWLSHQEVVITQLINRLFDSADGNPDIRNADDLRLELLGVYQDPSFVLLYKRLHASLLFGALALPKEALCRGKRLREDLGRKRSFLSLWLDTYDLNALRAAAETVIGRRMTVSLRGSQNGTSNQSSDITSQPKALRRAIEAFLDTFLLRNEDIEKPPSTREETSTVTLEHSRTVLRSILIVVLLDKSRLRSRSSLPHCIFRNTSQYKSSKAVLQALGSQLLPSIGDMIRSLSHLDCHVSYEQNPLQEYRFRVDNLAVDLRDGVLLTRVVELLLFVPTARAISTDRCNREMETVALKMPEGEILDLNEENGDWPLSRHLKFPCHSRSVKLYNVQIALTALQGAKGVGHVAQRVHVEEIVDGYREKTIALLWCLIGKWGLSSLIDWNDVQNEINWLRPKEPPPFLKKLENEEGSEHEGHIHHEQRPDECTYLLIEWASAIAQRSGIWIKNLSTDFADGKVFESIVKEYEPLIGKPVVNDMSNPGQGGKKTISKNDPNTCLQPRNAQLKSRLQQLGCSVEFASLVCPSTAPRIFDSDFVLGALAFLCSRLVPASKRARAAMVLQRQWRDVLERRSCRLRLLAKEIAVQCATVVRTRDRILWAKRIIVQWWRIQKRRRQMVNLKRPSGTTTSIASKAQLPRKVAPKGNVVFKKRGSSNQPKSDSLIFSPIPRRDRA